MNDHVNDVPLQLHLSHLPQSQDRCLGAKQAHRSSRQPQLLNLDAAKNLHPKRVSRFIHSVIQLPINSINHLMVEPTCLIVSDG